MEQWLNRVHFGDCLETLRRMPDGIVNTCVTSPPYFGLRDYGHPGQIGLEDTPEQFIAKLVDVFREVRRVLRDDGTAWVNMGDSYNAHPGQRKDTDQAGEKQQTVRGATAAPSRSVAGCKPKDLIGVPWMLAFALRQPYEKVAIKDKIDRAWLAALVDGEGCMTIFEADNGKGTAKSYLPILQVKMCDPECIRHANAITGFEQNLHQASPSTKGNRDTYQWRITGRRAADIAAEIYPYLRIKRKQAVILWNHQLIRDGYETKRGVPMPDEARAEQQQCRELIQKLNQKQSVDIPDWMVEPRINVEPGWYLRQDVIWAKPNPMPESVTDRCTKSHEYIFLLSKSPRYYFDQQAIKEAAIGGMAGNVRPAKGAQAYKDGSTEHRTKAGLHAWAERQRESVKKGGFGGKTADADQPAFRAVTEDRNKRSVWTVATKPYSGAHFATFPPELIEPCILAGAPAGGVVLDPFFGSGTTGEVSQRLGRQWIGCELNPDYKPLQDERLRQPGLVLEKAA